MDDLELQRLEAVADAVPAVLDLLFADDQGHDGRVIELSVALDILKGRNISNISDEDLEYDDGPWASTGFDSDVDVAGHQHFPSPDVSHKDEEKPPIRIEPLEEGFFVQELRPAVDQVRRAFTDRVDAAVWLLGWLGFEEEIVESVRDILAGLWGADELVGRAVSWNDPEQRKPPEYERALDVVSAAWAFVEATWGFMRPTVRPDEYNKLMEAVKKWRMGDANEANYSSKRIRDEDVPGYEYKFVCQDCGALDVAEAAQAYVEGVAAGEHTAEFAVAYDRMEEAVMKWRGIDEASNDPGLP